MQVFAQKVLFIISVSLALFSANTQAGQHSPGLKQLLAVRGEIVKLALQSKGMIAITVRPSKEFAEVTVIARENDLVGNAVSRESSSDLLGLLGDDDPREDEKITAAELREGDIVSIIYDPQQQNRALEIYLH
jgi:hypothetical protein